ncbi:MAG: hypothetical protein EOO91_17165 [Pedobacter sp.]|nr:MAG: hypothetical protein EOO91_17165 [Pedobacter sp.]
MALFDGKNLKGSLGNLSFRPLRDGLSSVQTKPGKGNVKQTANTKKSASLFGSLVSPFAKHIRFHFKGLVNEYSDRQMVNRINSAISIIINQHLEPDGKIVFNAESFNRLKGLEFNTNSPLVDSLLTMPKISFEDDKVHITIPSFKVAKNIKFPEDTYQVSMQIQPVFFKLSRALAFRAAHQSIDLEKTQGMTAEQTFSYDFPAGSVCIFALSLTFSTNRTIFNKKVFNPAGIFAASYKEGIVDDEIEEGWYTTSFRVEE